MGEAGTREGRGGNTEPCSSSTSLVFQWDMGLRGSLYYYVLSLVSMMDDIICMYHSIQKIKEKEEINQMKIWRYLLPISD